MKIPNKRELQQIAISHSSDIDFKDFINIYKKCTDEAYSFLVSDTILHQIILWDLEKIFITYNKNDYQRSN